MVDFSFTEEQEMYRQAVRRFAREVLAPRRQRWDREREYPWEVVQKFSALGLADPEMDHVTRGIMVEEVSYADFNCAFPILITTLPFELLRLPGVPAEVRQPLVEGLHRGTQVFGLGFTEPEAGTDMAGFRTTATKEGDHWLINGCKNSMSFANCKAVIITCKTSTERSVRFLTNILVPADAAGVSQPRFWDDAGTHGTPRGVMFFENVRVPLSYTVGREGHGYEMVAEVFDTNRAYIGLWCLGSARASVDEAVEYAKKRVSMGQTISRYQAVSFTLAEAATLMEAARWLCFKDLWLADRGERHSVEGAMCKWWVPEVAFEVVRRCLIIHGHYGYTRDLPFEQRLRDILGWQIGDGTPEVSKLIIARSLLGKESVG
ncbi:MAG: acyl-CoA dehydrogenase family protein [Chloroflexota bacterium]